MKHLILLCILVKYVVLRFLFESAPKHLQVRMASVGVSSWLVICRNYCVEFSLFISDPFTRARIPGILHFLLSQPSPKGTKKTLEFS